MELEGDKAALTSFPLISLYRTHLPRRGRQYSRRYASAYSTPRPFPNRPCVAVAVIKWTVWRSISNHSRASWVIWFLGHQAPPRFSAFNLEQEESFSPLFSPLFLFVFLRFDPTRLIFNSVDSIDLRGIDSCVNCNGTWNLMNAQRTKRYKFFQLLRILFSFLSFPFFQIYFVPFLFLFNRYIDLRGRPTRGFIRINAAIRDIRISINNNAIRN